MVESFDSLDKTAAVLRQGGVAVFPTDTVYGVGVSPVHAKDPSGIYRAKNRPADKPVAWLVGGPDDLLSFGKDVPAWALSLARAFWPGALTLVVNAADEVPRSFCSPEGTIGLRCPANPTALSLISKVGAPLATSSANLSGEEPASRADELSPDFLQGVDAVVVDNEPRSGVASTVVSCVGASMVVLRQGGLSERELLAVMEGES